MKRTMWVVLTLLLGISMAFGGTIRGVVKDAQTGEALVGANVILAGSMIGTTTDQDGAFVLTEVPSGRWNIIVDYLGYMEITHTLTVGERPVTIDLNMKPTIFEGEEVLIEVNRAQERKTPVAFTEVSEDEISRRYATQDVPDLLTTTPGVFTSSSGLGESEIFIRGFDAERIQILINGIPVNDPESQVVYWSNWTGLSGNASSIQVQRGVGSSLVGSGAFGGSVNIVTSRYSPTSKLVLRSSFGGYYVEGGAEGTIKVADGTGGIDTYNPFNQAISVEYTSGLMMNGKLNVFLKYERKSGSSYITATDYNGHSFYLGLQSILGNHILTFNAHGAPQRHNQASAMQDMLLLDRLGREYNRYNHPYQENYYFKPQFELHHDWAISENAYMKTNAFVTFGIGGGRYLRNDFFDVNTGLVGFKDVTASTDAKYFGRHARFIYETTGAVLKGYDPGNQTYTYNGETTPVTSSSMLISSTFNHSWRNDSQNHHKQFGINTAYQRKLNDLVTFTIGGEARHWRAEHYAQSFDFRKYDLETGGVKVLQEVQERYNYDGIVTNLSGFGRLLISPIEPLTLMLDGQYASYSSKVEENPIRVYDFGGERWLTTTYLSTKDKVDENGNRLYSDEDYERTFTFFMPKVGANYNVSPYVNVFANYSISKKEPKVGDWYERSDGPGADQPGGGELKEETLNNIEVGLGFSKRSYNVKANFYVMNFKDKIESITNQAGDRETINAGEAKHQGVELAANARYNSFDLSLSGTYARNRWQQMNLQEIFGESADDVVDKVVPFFPERMFAAEVGYNFGPFRFGLNANYWDEYYGNYTNTASLPAFFELGAVVSYRFTLANADVDMRLNLNNLLNRENFVRAAWTTDYNRNDEFVAVTRMYVVQAPLFHTFFTTQISL